MKSVGTKVHVRQKHTLLHQPSKYVGVGVGVGLWGAFAVCTSGEGNGDCIL